MHQSENSLGSFKLDGQYIGMDSSVVPEVKYFTCLVGTWDFTHVSSSLQPVFIRTLMTKKKKSISEMGKIT